MRLCATLSFLPKGTSSAAILLEQCFANSCEPVISVHATSLFYYLVELFLTTHTMIDAFGRPIYPLRYVMWTCSVSPYPYL